MTSDAVGRTLDPDNDIALTAFHNSSVALNGYHIKHLIKRTEKKDKARCHFSAISIRGSTNVLASAMLADPEKHSDRCGSINSSGSTHPSKSNFAAAGPLPCANICKTAHFVSATISSMDQNRIVLSRDVLMKHSGAEGMAQIP